MTPTEVGKALAYPLTNAAVLMSSLLLFLLLKLCTGGGVLGLFLVALILPAASSYLMRILDARARGQDPGPMRIEDLQWFGRTWSLLVIVHVFVLIYATYLLGSRYGPVATLVVISLLAVALPASLAVLAITRSPLRSLDPRSVSAVIGRCRGSYWVLPTYFIAAAVLLWWSGTLTFPGFFVAILFAYFVVAFFTLIGAVIRTHQLYDEVEIHTPLEPDQGSLNEKLLRERTTVLGHAYGFISRDNREGGMQHIYAWLERDPAPHNAWQWFFDQMLRWEVKEPGLIFAQSYLSRLLHDGDYGAAVKLMQRCRYVSESFLPLADDRELACEAAQHCGNEDLLEILRQ